MAIPCYMLCFFVFKVLFYALRRWEIYSFFSEGKKREGKCSFCFLSAKRVGQKQNVHFPLRWAFLFVLFRISQECKFWTEEYCLQTEEYKFQTLQYNIQMWEYELQTRKYYFQTCQYILQTEEYKKILTKYSVRMCEYKIRTV